MGSIEQDNQAEIEDDLSTKESFSNEKRLLTLVHREDENIAMKQSTSVGGRETEMKMKQNEDKVEDERDHLTKLRDSAHEQVMELAREQFIAKEPSSGSSSPLHTPSLLASIAHDGDKDNEQDKEPEAIPGDDEKIYSGDVIREEISPVQAAPPSTNLETLVNSDLQNRSARSAWKKHVYNSQTIAKSKEDDFIAEFDDFLDEVEEAMSMEENSDPTAQPLRAESPDSKIQDPLSVHGNDIHIPQPINNEAFVLEDDNEDDIEDGNSRAVANITDALDSLGSFSDLRPCDFPSGKKDDAVSNAKKTESTEKTKGIKEDTNTEVQDDYLSVDLGSTWMINQEMMEENIQSNENSSGEKAGSRDSRRVTDGNEESVFGNDRNVNNEGSIPKNQVHDEESPDNADSPPSLLQPIPALGQSIHDTSPSSSNIDSFLVEGEEVNALEIQHEKEDVDVDSVVDLSEGLVSYDLAPPNVDNVRKEFSSAHQDSSSTPIDDKLVVVGDELKPKLQYDKQSDVHITISKDRNSKEDNKTIASSGKAGGGGASVPDGSTKKKSMEDDVSQINKLFTNVIQHPHAAKNSISDKDNAKRSKPSEDEFIDDFDRFLDEVEEDIQIEEKRGVTW
ncbi:hypothetical protein OS493_021180 [Desmophyllum pertusum]|uniref:Uncharacterized protein n=1 Tax=Desmophyllum pertusum TaxID=174260 RepID=A0A9W9ZRA6_9CNID|nr:hypothetical protein OS493_021180 [Desmophyllum pertusum]